MENVFKNRTIIIGITGSIAAYKTPLLVRELKKYGADVHVIMTPSAVNFVTPLLMENLSRNPVLVEMFEKSAQSGGAWHIHHAHNCDAMIIAPCSASTLGKIANGICDTALVAVAMALPKGVPLLLAPAMDSSMWLNAATQRNVNRCKEDGIIIIPPEEGELSSGFSGPGRMPDVDVLLEALRKVLSEKVTEEKRSPVNAQEKKTEVVQEIAEKNLQDALDKSVFTLDDAVDKDKWTAELEYTELKTKKHGEKTLSGYYKGTKVLITAGPTIERLDDVRFISNYSSGKMGYAIASEAQKLGADVTLICGPVTLITPPGVHRIDVDTAQEMYDVVLKEFPSFDIAILSAAVADYKPAAPAEGKIKKETAGEKLIIELESTKDILAELGRLKSKKQKVIGFALESSDEIENGWKKLKAKNCDMIVVNSANKPRSGFQGDDNTITILTRDGKEQPYPAMSKQDCGRIILQAIVEL